MSADVIRLKAYTEVPNTGDQFAVELAKRRFGTPTTVLGEEPLDECNLILGGSIVHWADRHSIVCGSGLLFAGLAPPQPPALVTSVRGPLTADSLRASGISCPDVFGDPGILAATVFPAVGPPTVDIGIVPHYVDAETPFVLRSRAMGVVVLDVRSPLPAFLAQLQRCRVVLSSSLHGLVFAHAYGRRALWIELSDRIHGGGFKFLDYYASIGVPPQHVDRHRVDDATDPQTLMERATEGDVEPLLAGLENALDEAARALTVTPTV